MWRLLVISRILAILAWSWHIRRNLGRRPLRLPAVAQDRTIDAAAAGRQVRLADRVINMLTKRTGHYCFYRSVTLAVLFRKQGLPLVVNVGGRALGSATRMKAHSWLTLHGEPFYEPPNAIDIYPLPMGYNTDGSVRYWIGPDLDDSLISGSSVARGSAARPAEEKNRPA